MEFGNGFGLSNEQMEQLKREVASAFNRVSFENLSNTPDFVLAEVAVNSALQFSKGVNQRDAVASAAIKP